MKIMDSSDNNNNAMPHPSTMPPGGSVAQRGQRVVSMGSGCQSRLPAAAVLDAFTPPPSRVIVQPSNLASAISSLLTSQEARAVPPGSKTRRLNAHLFNSLESSDEDIPSPKKTLLDFTLRKSDDDFVASGNDSISWEKEEDRVIHLFANQLVLENV
jgi:hypothetical protein